MMPFAPAAFSIFATALTVFESTSANQFVISTFASISADNNIAMLAPIAIYQMALTNGEIVFYKTVSFTAC